MSTQATLLDRILPSAESPNWPLFALLLVAILALGPSALDAWRRVKYQVNPQIERRSATPCDVHSARISAMQAVIDSQNKEIAAIREAFADEIGELRTFIEAKLEQYRISTQQDRLGSEERMSRQFSDLIRIFTSHGASS